MLGLLSSLFVLATGVLSAPSVERRILSGPVTALSTAQVNSYIPYCWFAAATYCPRPSQVSWSCSEWFGFAREPSAERDVEESCQADPVKDFVVYNSGGDGGKVQFWYVGWWPSGQSVVIAHQGTELNDTQAVLTDLNLVPLPLDTTHFPGAPALALVHSGFKNAHGRTATVILDTVKQVIQERGAKTVISVGHSLGGALALLEGLHMRLNLPSSVNVITRTFGQPRVGNDVFAQFVDQMLPDLARLTIKRDIVPVLPPLTTLFRHSSGEVHLDAEDVFNACSGRDNMNENCSTGQVLTQGIQLVDHLGPYPGGVQLGTQIDIGALC
ncbi:hypothetical protein FRC08_014821 [Ceratobasidium sp. 394]|nr:hypothetical protein FRC08_014821 [Ceratobasidium sp. 394]